MVKRSLDRHQSSLAWRYPRYDRQSPPLCNVKVRTKRKTDIADDSIFCRSTDLYKRIFSQSEISIICSFQANLPQFAQFALGSPWNEDQTWRYEAHKHSFLWYTNSLLIWLSVANDTVYRHPLAIISDFGISKRVATRNSHTSCRGLTEEWASPEQLDERPHGRSSDIFSLGLIFAYILFKAADINRIELKLRAPDAFSYHPGTKSQIHLNEVVNRIGSQIGSNFDYSIIELMQTMLCLNQNERPKITTVQAKVEDFLYHTDACIQLHCGMKRRDSDET